MRRTLLALVFGLAAGCKGSSGGLEAGKPCTASSECADGLICDFGQSPPVCAGMLTVPPDAAPQPDADPTAPDAAPQPDAPPGTPDAAPMPDAPPMMPDASAPDAAPIDAGVPDA